MLTKLLRGPLSPDTDTTTGSACSKTPGSATADYATAGTVLMLLGVPDRVIDHIMGWEPGGAVRMRARYLHATDPMLRDAARKIEQAIWGAPETARVAKTRTTGAERTTTGLLR